MAPHQAEHCTGHREKAEEVSPSPGGVSCPRASAPAPDPDWRHNTDGEKTQETCHKNARSASVCVQCPVMLCNRNLSWLLPRCCGARCSVRVLIKAVKSPRSLLAGRGRGGAGGWWGGNEISRLLSHYSERASTSTFSLLKELISALCDLRSNTKYNEST